MPSCYRQSLQTACSLLRSVPCGDRDPIPAIHWGRRDGARRADQALIRLWSKARSVQHCFAKSQGVPRSCARKAHKGRGISSRKIPVPKGTHAGLEQSTQLSRPEEEGTVYSFLPRFLGSSHTRHTSSMPSRTTTAARLPTLVHPTFLVRISGMNINLFQIPSAHRSSGFLRKRRGHQDGV